jgi:signal transduction histidine kinase
VVAIRTAILPDLRVLRTFTDVSVQHAARAERDRARQAAEHAIRSRLEFIGVVSHELRTPLNAILGFTGLLLTQEPTPNQAHDLRLVEAAGQQLLAMVEDILDVAQIERGELILHEQRFDPRLTLRAAAGAVATRAEAKGLSFALVLEEGVPNAAVGDAARLRQVVLKLLDNAVKFTAEGTITLRAALLREDAAGWRLGIAVTDTGIGIAEADMAALFDPLVQVDGSATRAFGGAGLGLAVCRLLLEAMGGTIAVESAPGAGSTFRCEVPLRRPPADAG